MSSYLERPWLKQYDDFVPKSLPEIPEELSLIDFINESVKKYPENPALITTVKLPLLGRQTSSINYQELGHASDALAAALVDMGLEKGDRVAIVMPNCTAFAIAYWGILKAGGVVAATNPTYPPGKLAHQINDCDAKIVIALSMFYDLVKGIQSETKVKHVIACKIKEYFTPLARVFFTLAAEKKLGHYLKEVNPGDYWLQDLLKKFDGKKANVKVSSSDLALFQYTGGTTGVSKGAMGDHRALVANVMQMQNWTGIAQNIPLNGIAGDKLTYLGAIPMFHSFGLIAMLTQANASGSAIVLVPNPRDINELVDVIDFYKPDVFLGVPALFNALNSHPRITNHEVSLESMKLNVSGSAPLPASTKREYEALSKSMIMEGFGMSETPVATHANPFKGEQRHMSIGLPYIDIDCRIVSLDDGETDVPIGDIGELIIAGPNLMRGYHKMPTETENVLRKQDGKTWLYTGDIARMDEDGYFYIVDRKKDMALIGGYNVYPAAVENVLKGHPAVFEVGVAAIPHPEKEGQEALKAWVVLKPDANVSEADLIDYCKAYLAQYEIPRRIAFVAEIPKSAVGKTLRRELVRLEMEDQEPPS